MTGPFWKMSCWTSSGNEIGSVTGVVGSVGGSELVTAVRLGGVAALALLGAPGRVLGHLLAVQSGGTGRSRDVMLAGGHGVGEAGVGGAHLAAGDDAR